jgi:hypothetical protein
MTGEMLWDDESIYEDIWGSPTLVGDMVYMTDGGGETHIFPLQDSFEVSSTGMLGEEVDATPAFLDGKIYFRTNLSLICVGTDDVPAAGQEEPSERGQAAE